MPQSSIITIIASGSRGDVQPYLALGHGLARDGFPVRFVTHDNYGSLVEGRGLEFYPVGGNIQEIAQGAEFRELLEKGNFLAIMRQMARAAESGAEHLVRASLDACQGASLLLGGLGGFYTAAALGEKFDLPAVQAYLIPFTPTREVSSFALPADIPGLGAVLNPISYHLARQLIWQGFRRADTLARRSVLNLPPAPFWGPGRDPRFPDLPLLYGYSPEVLPRPLDWPDHVHITGYWFLDEDESWAPPEDLAAFLKAEPRPVYIGFGSMSSRNPRETADLILDAVKISGQRAVIQSGWGGLESEALPEDIFLVGSIPHSWLFPRTAAVVHHGGAGTTAAGLRAGVPSVVVPYFGDQPYWGRQVQRLGVGPAPIPRKRLTSGKLAAALRQATADEDLRIAAARLGQTIRSEDGVSRGVEVISGWLNKNNPVPN